MKKFRINLVGSGNLAFVIVVAAAYLSATSALIYSRRALSALEIGVLLAAGLAYLVVGTYGFNIARQSGTRRAAAIYFVVQILIAATLIKLRGSAGELSLILLPLAGQSALLLSSLWMGAVCALIYTVLVLPLILRNRWIDAIAVALVYGTGIVFVVVFTRIAASEREARAGLGEANRLLRENAAQVEELATTKERNRLAREIHDSRGQPSVAAKVVAEFARLTSKTAAPSQPYSEPLIEPLSDREREILSLISNGANNREIANTLFLAEGTVKNHVTNILGKLGVRDRTQAALKAKEMRLT